ncbi:MAG: hypothetical protein IAF38_14650 [Bacteroidia bacterium]|nr:hypothetical protein [Bacteroidia bacterium]
MTKSDKSKHNICIASIKRSTFKPYDYKRTKFYETNSNFYTEYPNILLDLSDEELIISSTIIDADNFSVLTTRQLITNEKGALSSGVINEASDESYGDFKGYETDVVTFGHVQLKDGCHLKYFVEIGKASMIMIHGVRTLIRTQQMTNTQVENVTRVWNRKNEK